MAVVIRLQGLSITAGSEDIRNFFTGLKIPDGGVHIIGGELGEAFIIFASDEDARRAMTRSGGCIKDFQVTLLLSSRSEMQKLLEDSTRRSEANRRNYKETVNRPVFEGRPASLNEGVTLEMQRGDKPKMGNRPPVMSLNESRSKKKGGGESGHYVYLSGMPFTVKKEDIAVFFDGIDSDDLLFMHNDDGLFNGCGLVKLRTREDAIEALKRDRKYIGSRYIRVLTASENQWIRSGGSVAAGLRKPRTRSRSPVRHRPHSPSNEEFGVLYENLSYLVEKRDIKVLLQPVPLTDNQISIFVDPKGSRNKSAIVLFRNLKDYCSGLAHHKKMFMHNVIYVSPVSKEKADKILECTQDPREGRRRSSRSSERSAKSACDAERRCIYVRNLPFDVRKVEIMDFFLGFQLSEDRVILLRDERGAGLGEALLIFPTEKEAVMAQSLNGQRFLGSEVMLKCITWAQMQEFGIDISSIMSEGNAQRNSPGYSSEPNFFNDRKYQDTCDMMSDAPHRDPGNRGVLDCFENPDNFGLEPRGPAPHRYGPAEQQFNQPTCVKLLNLPIKIRVDEIYDFCYGYRVVPGSVSLEYSRSGVPTGSATVVFENHTEALNAVQELNGRPIGTRKINIVFV